MTCIRLTLLANRASPSPLLGQSLGQYGLNIQEFCKHFNLLTQNLKGHVFVPTLISFSSRDSFSVTLKTPSSSFLLCSFSNISKGSSSPKKLPFHAFILLNEIFHLALFKHSDRFLSHICLLSLSKSLIGSALSLGLRLHV